MAEHNMLRTLLYAIPFEPSSLWTVFAAFYWDKVLLLGTSSADNPALRSNGILRELQERGVLGHLKLDVPPACLREDIPRRLRERFWSELPREVTSRVVRNLYSEHGDFVTDHPDNLLSRGVLDEVGDLSMLSWFSELRLLAALAEQEKGKYTTFSSDKPGTYGFFSRTPVYRWKGTACLTLEINHGFPIPSERDCAGEVLDVCDRLVVERLTLWQEVNELCQSAHEASYPSQIQKALEKHSARLSQAIRLACSAYAECGVEYDMASAMLHFFPKHERFWSGIADIASVPNDWLARTSLTVESPTPSSVDLEMGYAWTHDYVYAAIGPRHEPYLCLTYRDEDRGSLSVRHHRSSR